MRVAGNDISWVLELVKTWYNCVMKKSKKIHSHYVSPDEHYHLFGTNTSGQSAVTGFFMNEIRVPNGFLCGITGVTGISSYLSLLRSGLPHAGYPKCHFNVDVYSFASGVDLSYKRWVSVYGPISNLAVHTTSVPENLYNLAPLDTQKEIDRFQEYILLSA